MRHDTSHEVVGRLVGFSADCSENAFVEVLPVLKRLFPNQRREAEKRYSILEEKWNPSRVEQVIVDSFETYLPRPSSNDKQKRYYTNSNRFVRKMVEWIMPKSLRKAKTNSFTLCRNIYCYTRKPKCPQPPFNISPK